LADQILLLVAVVILWQRKSCVGHICCSLWFTASLCENHSSCKLNNNGHGINSDNGRKLQVKKDENHYSACTATT